MAKFQTFFNALMSFFFNPLMLSSYVISEKEMEKLKERLAQEEAEAMEMEDEENKNENTNNEKEVS